jgi:hypothetical protein
MEQELINFIKTEIEKYTGEDIYKYQLVIFFKQFETQLENRFEMYFLFKLVQDQVLNNLFSNTVIYQKKFVNQFLDQILSTHNFIINNHEKNN